MKQTFKHYSDLTISTRYSNSQDREYIHDAKTMRGIIRHYAGQSETFEYTDWYGSTTLIKATITRVWIDTRWEKGFCHWYAEVLVNKRIPEHYVPTTFQILNGKMRHPISCSTVDLSDADFDYLEEIQ